MSSVGTEQNRVVVAQPSEKQLQSHIAPYDMPMYVVNKPKCIRRDKVVTSKDIHLKKIERKNVEPNIHCSPRERFLREAQAQLKDRLQKRDEEDAKPDEAIRVSLLAKCAQKGQ
jgi:hypothetical protein